MAPNKIRRALGAVKDTTSIGLAKVNSSNFISDLEIAIIKATRHEEHPADEKYVRVIMSLTSYSRTYISACVNILSRRLNKTKNWIVALKTLVLIHRLLLEGDPAYEQEIFFATRSGTRLLNMSDFRDTSLSNSWDFSAFVRTFALYLDQRLEFRIHGRRGRRNGLGYDDDEIEAGTPQSVKTTPVHDLKTERIFLRIQHLQQLLERFIACRPTGAAKHNRMVMAALYQIVKESFHIYFDIAEIMGILVDRFMEMEVPDCIRVHEIFARLGKQFDELDSFYCWCKKVGICKSSDYPEVERITPKKLDIMDEFIRDKSFLAQMKRANNHSAQHKNNNNLIVQEEKVIYKEPEPEQAVEEEEDMSKIKALPPTEGFSKDKEESKQGGNNTQQEADFLNLQDDTLTTQEPGDKLALALFDGGSQPSALQASPWEAFESNDSGDWETALVQSASNLSSQGTSLAGGFNMLLLDGMYQQSAVNAATLAAQGGYGGTGSASSVVTSGKPAMLALPAPPVSGNVGGLNADPFAASLSVPPPAYVQMSELEKKQKLLMEEQVMWQQYARDGMQGQFGLLKVQQNYYPYNTYNTYNTGGYAPSY